ncbi:transcriptional regulator [Bacillus manliponensis]|uniref:glycosyl hydrolase family 8 n=1 Tax=Bacillus manliponensis TaxID=574376 RepID=UPI00351263EC
MNKKWYIAIIVVVILVGSAVYIRTYGNATEKFIMRYMMNENGTLATYRLESEKGGTDIAAGREALSESAGLWLQYALDKKDQSLFDEQMKVIQSEFLDKTNIVLWKIEPSGERQTRTNALIDDLRIIEQLYRAYELYDENRYKQLADRISDAVLQYNKKGRFFVDYYDAEVKVSNETLTTSYVNPKAFFYMKKYGKITEKDYNEVIQFLADYPRHGWAFPKTYEKDDSFTYDKEVNLIDQSYVAYHRSLAGLKSDAYLKFLKQTFEQEGKLYGRYHLESGKPAASFESPAAYGLTILYLLEEDETEFANQLYDRMKMFRNDWLWSRFYGGYVTGKEKDTHIFDNVLPLLAETAM